MPSYIRFADELERIYKGKDYYPWDSKKIADFNKSERKKIKIQSAKYMLKSFMVRLMIQIKKVSKISYGQKIETKLEVYSQLRIKNSDVLKEIDHRLAPLVMKERRKRSNR